MSLQASLVIPVLRQRDAWLEQAIRSALVQTVPCEVLVVVEGETPASNRQIIERIADENRTNGATLRPLFHDRPRGFPQALNLGMRSATTERIGILLSDDWLDPTCVAECRAHDSDIVSAGLRVFLADGVTPLEGCNRPLRMSRFLSLPTLEKKAAYLSHFFLFQKRALEQVGYVDETIGDYPGIDDHHLIWTLLEHHATVAIVEKNLYNYRDHDGDRLTLADAEQAVRNLEKILHKHGMQEPEFSQVVAGHRRWYGRPIHEVLREK